MPPDDEHAAEPERVVPGQLPLDAGLDDEPGEDHVCVAEGLSLAAAHEEGLVVLACGEPYWVIRQEHGYCLLVHRHRAEAIRSQLDLFRDESARPRGPKPRPVRAQRIRWSLLLLSPAFWCLMFASIQINPAIREAGLMESDSVVHDGQWWRLVTALSLHGDIGHLVGNCMGWLLFGGFLASSVGVGMASLLALVAGALGNGVNALLTVDDFRSLGASTALFAALGAQTGMAFFQRQGRLWQRVAVPFLAALALLALLGTGEVGRTDVGAHLWGFACGIVVALPVARIVLRQKATLAYDSVLMLVCSVVFYAAWALAL